MPLIYGIHTVTESLKRGGRRIKRLVVSKTRKKNLQELLALANEKGVQVDFREDHEIERQAKGANHQGVLLDIEEVRQWDLDSALKDMGSMAEQVWLALDEIEDPMNLGAILRSAACFGVQAVLLPERRSAQVTPTVEKVASGGLEAVKVVGVGNLNQAILQLRENGFRIVGSVAPGYKLPEPEGGKKPWHKGPQPTFALNYARPMLLVIGSEGKGIHLKVAEKCDDLVYIPQAPSGVESLNASAAAAVLLYEIFRQSKSCQSCA